MDRARVRQQKARRHLRRQLGAPPLVDRLIAGPPELNLADRRSLLEQLRNEIARCGLEPSEIRGGWGYRVRAGRADVGRLLAAEEESADHKQHWWLRDVVWRSPDGESTLVYSSDPDGHDLSFVGWGADVQPVLEAVGRLLAAHQP